MIFTVAFFLSFAFVNAQEDTTVTNTAVTNVSETSSNDTAPSINKKAVPSLRTQAVQKSMRKRHVRKIWLIKQKIKTRGERCHAG